MAMEAPIFCATLTDEDIRRIDREQSRKIAMFQKKLGFVPDLEDWDEYEDLIECGEI